MPTGDPGAQGLTIACDPALARIVTCGATLAESRLDGVDHSLPATVALSPAGAFAGLALEPQHWPDAPDHPDFPPITQHPGETCTRSSPFRFFRKDPQ